MPTRPGSPIYTYINDSGPQGHTDGSDGAVVMVADKAEEAGPTVPSEFRDDSALASATSKPRPTEGKCSSGFEVEPDCRVCVRDAQQACRTDVAFRRWFHRNFKQDQRVRQGTRHNLDMDASQVLEAWREWVASGRPGMK